MVLADYGLRHGQHTHSKERTAKVNHCTAGESVICQDRATMLGIQVSDHCRWDLIS